MPNKSSANTSTAKEYDVLDIADGRTFATLLTQKSADGWMVAPQSLISVTPRYSALLCRDIAPEDLPTSMDIASLAKSVNEDPATEGKPFYVDPVEPVTPPDPGDPASNTEKTPEGEASEKGDSTITTTTDIKTDDKTNKKDSDNGNA